MLEANRLHRIRSDGDDRRVDGLGSSGTLTVNSTSPSAAVAPTCTFTVPTVPPAVDFTTMAGSAVSGPVRLTWFVTGSRVATTVGEVNATLGRWASAVSLGSLLKNASYTRAAAIAIQAMSCRIGSTSLGTCPPRDGGRLLGRIEASVPAWRALHIWRRADPQAILSREVQSQEG